MDDAEFGGFFVQLVTAGNDTTKTMMSSGMHQLVRHPDQLQALRDDPSLIPGAVEEMLRFCNPVHYQRRTAVRDTVLGGKQIAAGDKVVMYYTSANRDEDVFADPAPLRHPPHPEPAPELRHRRALLPRRPARAPRGAGLLRGAARRDSRTIELAGSR